MLYIAHTVIKSYGLIVSHLAPICYFVKMWTASDIMNGIEKPKS